MKYFDKPNIKIDYSSITSQEMQDSKYIKPLSICYKEGGFDKRWDIVKSMDSVSIVIFNTTLQAFVLVRQFRPAVFFNQENQDGYTYELCAGLVDKAGKSLEEIAAEEVLEECGYKVLPSELIKIGSFLSATGMNGSMQHLFFVEVDEGKKANQGGGIDDECLEVLYLPIDDGLKFIFDEKIPKTTSLFLGIHWYYYNFKDK